MIDSGFQDIVSQARKLLTDSPFIELHKIDVMQSGERVTLRGEVASFFMKQLAQETVRSATRGLEVSNEVAVDFSRRLH
jgi:osmotically-inducible protein OsmY